LKKELKRKDLKENGTEAEEKNKLKIGYNCKEI